MSDTNVGLMAIKDRTLALWRDLRETPIERKSTMASETSNKHYDTAVELLQIADALKGGNDLLSAQASDRVVANILAAAQVHATLALATKDW